MSHRSSAAADVAEIGTGLGAGLSLEEILLASRSVGDGLWQTDLSVPTIHCGGCIQRIERALNGLDGVERARVNLSTKRVAIRWREGGAPPAFVATLIGLGHEPHLYEAQPDGGDKTLSELIRALAVAGFAASNIMLLSVSVWSGAEPATRDLFHWLSAAIALPALAYSGRIFFRSAWQALRHGRTNMDVPISVGVLLAFGMSLYDTIHSGRYAYFDASITLLFFLLIGRTLDHVMREKARVAVTGLARLAPRGAFVVRADGTHEYLPVAEIEPGMTILVAAGERVSVDGRVESGTSDLDCSLVTGEGTPQPASAGSTLQAGALNLTGPLTIKVTEAARDSFLAEMIRLMETAEATRSGYRRIADRAARLYAPIVHAAAFLSFVCWMVATADIHQAITIAVAVLIITCPCALGLAVPIVQVVAARRLFESGIMVKDGSAMERLGEIDTVVFDKTGTLTLGCPSLISSDGIDPENFALAAAMAAHSRHPYSQAVVAAKASRARSRIVFDSVTEQPGSGVEARSGADVFRLGRATWALDRTASVQAGSGEFGTILSKNGRKLEVFQFHDRVRPGAREAIAELAKQGMAIDILSGDRASRVQRLADDLGVAGFDAGVLPKGKAARLTSLAAAGRRVLMVGDGLNDAPALAAAHVSMAPATAADVGRNAADFVFLRESLEAVSYAVAVSRDAGRLIRQNFGLAVVYNAIALPFAVLGFVTPFAAAVAMSSSSILVVANALRLAGGERRRRRARPKMRGQALATDPVE